MAKSLYNLLHEMVSAYYNSGITTPLKEYMTLPRHINQMTKCCNDNGINILADKIRDFIIKLFEVDPKGISCINEQKPTTFQPSGYPYPVKVNDFNKPRVNNPFPNDYRPQNDYRVQPQCPNQECEKQAYFGLPFCPHCMKQIPPFIPKLKNSMQASVLPIMKLSDLDTKPVKEKVVAMVGGVEKTFDMNDIIVKNKDMCVTYADVENEMKNISQYIPD